LRTTELEGPTRSQYRPGLDLGLETGSETVETNRIW